MDNITLITPTTCVDAAQKVYEFCLPVREQCSVQPLDSQLAIDGQEWNCAMPCVQQNRKYFIPFEQGDLIHFQTLFYSGTQASPTAYDTFITAEIFYSDGTSTTVIPGARKMSAWNDGKPYQILEVDTTTIDKCFRIKFTVVGDANTYTTQWYKPDLDCIDTITLKSIHDKEDCLGYQYEIDSFVGDQITYDNSVKIFGSIKDSGITISKEINEVTGRSSSRSRKREFEVRTHRKMPPYMKNIIADQHLTADEIIIDGTTYEVPNITLDNEVTSGDMWRFSFEVYQECDDSGSGKFCD